MSIRICMTGSSERGVTAYLDALKVCAADLEVSLLLPGQAAGELEAAMAAARGLLVTGGVDIHPREYGRDPAGTEMETVQPERDALERRALRHADSREIPILAICRGMQMLAVHCGGGLLQDIGQLHRDGRLQEEKWRPFHAVEVDPASRLARVLGASRVEVNSRHHQAIDPSRIGSGLSVTARSPLDATIEGVEAPGERFVIGVQWHPENMALGPEATPERAQARALFAAFAEAANSSRG